MRFILGLLLLLILPGLAGAKDFTDKYVPVDMRTLTRFTGNFNIFNLADNNIFAEYLAATECDIYKTVKDNQFKQQKIRELILKRIASQSLDKELFFRVPVMFAVSNYNFETRALTLNPSSRMNKVTSISIGDRFLPVCDGKIGNDLSYIPYTYNVKLNFPISLFRLPVQKDIAENLFERLDMASSDGKKRIIYGNFYIQIDPIQPKAANDSTTSVITFFGQVNAIDLYRDSDRKILLKRLDYSQ